MLEVTKIRKGIVIDHIKSGLGYEIFNYLGLSKVDYPVALIMNVDSKRLGKKDIIKVANKINIDFTVLGLLSPSITIDIVDDEKIINKIIPELPEEVENIIKCKNPRCITNTERDIRHLFRLTDREHGTYRCEYCDEKHNAIK